MHRVFVYGTLKRGFCNHHLLKNSVFAGSASTASAYRLLDGEFPVIRDRGPDRLQVSGELYDVDDATLARLDELEGVSEGMYDRATIEVATVTPPHERSLAFAYIGCGPYWDSQSLPSCRTLDAQGHIDWKPGQK
jgi:gamma-glutamylcyclotransferase (GGCT)/AIG2-like uncharacterized protein YtfP